MDEANALKQALALMEAGRFAEALTALEEAETRLGRNEDLRYARALALMQLDKKHEARAVLQDVLEKKPSHRLASETLASMPKTGEASAWVPRPAAVALPFAATTLPNHRMTGPYGVVAPNPLTLLAYALSDEAWNEILSFHSLLATDEYVKGVDAYYRECRSRYGKHWHYLDAVNTLYAAAKLIKPEHYLEIGVRRGRSACTVARACPDVTLHAFDMWIQGYAGMDNPGPAFVRQELQKHGHRGQVTFTDGDSHRTVPEYLARNPNLQFDLVLVDGDHSEDGAYDDLRNVLPRIRSGGMVIFDDITHPAHPYLLKVWRKAMDAHPGFMAHEFTESGYGIAFAVKKG